MMKKVVDDLKNMLVCFNSRKLDAEHKFNIGIHINDKQWNIYSKSERAKKFFESRFVKELQQIERIY